MLRTANIIGSGPNGLAAAITLAQRGVEVTVYERMAYPGGACATEELTLPGFHHDTGATVLPIAIASPFFQTLPLEHHGLRWIQPPAPLAHPFDDGTSVLLERDLTHTAAQFEDHDHLAWLSLFSSVVADWPSMVKALTRPLLRVPKHPLGLAHFGMHAAMPASFLARLLFRGERARAMLAGNCAHSVLPLENIASSGAGLTLIAAAHATGWPFVEGGARNLARAMASYFTALGGIVWLNAEIEHLDQLDPADVTLFDTSPRALDRIASGALTPSFRTRMRHYDYGPGAFKIDWALSEPIPWKAAGVRRAGTVHLGGTFAEIAASESAAFKGRRNDKPFVLLTQPTLFDPTRAPEGKHIAWAYCHLPNGSAEDYTDAIESQVERFAPGFRDTILARHVHTPATLERWNHNLIGGDVSGGAMTLSQLINRPTAHLYATSNTRIFLCSASTPPGGGVHGMCGHLAALAALKSLED